MYESLCRKREKHEYEKKEKSIQKLIENHALRCPTRPLKF
jgi:hypothetical protein